MTEHVNPWWAEEVTPLAPPRPDITCEAGWIAADQTNQPCGDPAVTWRIDAEDSGQPWPVCDYHTPPKWAHS